jgi:hypothetical protein
MRKKLSPFQVDLKEGLNLVNKVKILSKSMMLTTTTILKKTSKQIEIKIMAYSEIIFNLVWAIKQVLLSVKVLELILVLIVWRSMSTIILKL